VDRPWIVALVAVTLIGGALRAGPALHPNPYRSVDELGYVAVALTVADTGRYGRDNRHWPPGAPLAFAAAARLAGHTRGDIPAAYAIQWLAGTALIPLVFLLTLRLQGDLPAALAAAAVVAAYPPLIAVTGDLLSEPLGALWLTAAFAFLNRPVAAGLLLAAAILTRANFLIVLPVLAVALGPRRGTRLAVAALVPIAAWSLNASALISTGGGSSLFVGTYLPGDGTLRGTKAALNASNLTGQQVMDAVAARRPDLAREAALRAAAWENVRTYTREDPLAYAGMFAAKLPRLWLTPSPRANGLRTPAMRIWHLIVIVLGVAGAIRLRNRAVLAALVAFTAFHLIVPAMPRYALPLLPVLIAAGCAGRRAPRTRPALQDSTASPARQPSREVSPSGSV
jgi:hypothetical protein